MTAEPTPYDKVQDTEIEALKEITTTSYEPPESAEVSFPIVNKPMNDEEWSHLMKAVGSGIISYGGAPYRLGNVNDVDNTVTIYAADDEGRESGGLIEGFAHQLKREKVITVPAVTQTTNYMIGLQYNPLHESSSGPVRLDCFSRPLDTTQGKKYIPIWEGTRSPSTVLSSVTWNTARSRISPTTTVARERYLPDPRHSGLMWGTLCYTYWDRKWFQLRWATEEGGEMVWVNITDPEWEEVADGTYVWPGHGYRRGQRRIGNTVELRGRAARRDGSLFLADGGSEDPGYTLMYVNDPPAQEQRFITASGGYTNQKLCVITVHQNGRVYGRPLLGNISWLSIDGIRYFVK
jgi:hypothetical protein